MRKTKKLKDLLLIIFLLGKLIFYYPATVTTYNLDNIMNLHDILIGDVESTLAAGNFGYHWSGVNSVFKPEPISTEMQAKVDETIGYQFLDLINSIRVRKVLHPLDWHQEIAEVAAEHSKDMYYNDFFAHDSPTTGSPGDRINTAGIEYDSWGENLTSDFNSFIFAHEVLMNSPYGHWESRLRENYTHIGAVVYQNKYYTEKFLN